MDSDDNFANLRKNVWQSNFNKMVTTKYLYEVSSPTNSYTDL